MSQTVIKTDVALVGAGIMSATLGALLRQLEPSWSISLFERLDAAAAESSDPWNNAGTGHSALCELNYTPKTADGDVNIDKALNINEQFQVSRQFWSHAVDNGILTSPDEFINPIPHVSFAHGQAGVDYLRKRHERLSSQVLFEGMEFIDDPSEFTKRLPLMSIGRDFSDPVALNWFTDGTDVDFGALTQQLLNFVSQGGDIHFGHAVTNLDKQSDGSWIVKLKNRRTGEKWSVHAKFVFVGAGGGALHLLQKSGIAEAKGFGGFPVSGEFFRCTNPDLIDQHQAKVYGQAAVGAPPMSVPHLDTRVINHKKGLLFGPYAGWSPKFLKSGKITDLPASVKPGNLIPMMSIAPKEFGLLKYLISELAASPADRVKTLQEFVPRALGSDWELITAGQRVQVIRKTGAGGSLEFGTAVVAAGDGTIAGLLGASPGASTAVPAMLNVLEQCFPTEYRSWTPKLTEMIPSFGQKLSDNRDLFRQVWDWTSASLQLSGNAPLITGDDPVATTAG
ncbi:MAG TPA: malate dehydrogenase (quinone) [Gordonia polyisoprenivorans]|uniref:Probable malate:quinone oxidoreductase n=1 Tax=Gordonia polyisoprenivorans TaxID=84595 RepID=A0A846WM57_9ACTN|nr:malate dehydrogenase (quinone) [Gordonia polyisoprenivorans]MBE7191821.1 malate dehydrogenase (quinone) [Gordonia polyisoprenivorans]NKY02678.1 malate dehydrogenase (quinone) [Gordonia polyisoprenivorans]OZC30205.1 malate dehydrogenase (quinone) [Gordonia polyisoprenivorans]QUD85399.1 malate dehydrogenase (quinone) [Gordonia polyisoprenivorans]UZF58528.1 malate dehydrogenase (quinone) [Gordonia polyisoprenivorans]